MVDQPTKGLMEPLSGNCRTRIVATSLSDFFGGWSKGAPIDLPWLDLGWNAANAIAKTGFCGWYHHKSPTDTLRNPHFRPKFVTGFRKGIETNQTEGPQLWRTEFYLAEANAHVILQGCSG